MGLEYNITYRKKDRGLQAIISYKDNNGRWKQKSKQGFEDSRKGKTESKQWALKQLENIKNNHSTGCTNDKLTFKEFSDMYIKHIELSYAAKTIELYNCALKKFKILESKEMQNITSLDIEKCVDKMVKDNINNNSISSYVDKIKAMFNYAVSHNIIIKNPVKVKAKRTKSKKTALTSSELEDLLIKMKKINIKYYIACLLAGKCGLRCGELQGLTWDDIDIRNININKQWKQNADKSWGFGKLKTANSKRIVPISNNVYTELMDYKKSLKTININKRILDYKTHSPMSKHMRKCLKDIGYDISIHELRHTYTTLLVQNGLDFKTVAALIGDDVSQVMETYSHVNDDMMSKAENLINSIF